MGLLFKALALPFKGPADATLWVAGKVAEAAEQQINDPNTLRAALIDAERRLEAGEIDEETYEDIETDLLSRLRNARR